MADLGPNVETRFDKGDVVIFRKGEGLVAGIITGYSISCGYGQSVRYDVAVNSFKTLTYINEGDVAESDIIYKLGEYEGGNTVRQAIKQLGKREE